MFAIPNILMRIILLVVGIVMMNRGLKVTMIIIFPQRNTRSVVIRLNAEAPNSNKLTEPGF